jgi:hypothetical protein
LYPYRLQDASARHAVSGPGHDQRAGERKQAEQNRDAEKVALAEHERAQRSGGTGSGEGAAAGGQPG